MGSLLGQLQGPARAWLSVLGALFGASLLLALLPAARAQAAPITIFDAAHEMRGEFGIDGREHALEELERLGVDQIRLIVYWWEVAPRPDDPVAPSGFDPRDPKSYTAKGGNWQTVDRVMRGAARHGMGVSLVPAGIYPTGRVPRWASNDPSGTQSDPDPAAFQDFMFALGTRYNGSFVPESGDDTTTPLPAAAMISAWNEPNNWVFLGPQKRNGSYYVPGLYRNLVFAARRGLTDSGWRGTFLIGETAPRPTWHAIAPLEFMRMTLCLNAKWKRVGHVAACPARAGAIIPTARRWRPSRSRRTPSRSLSRC